MQNWYPQLIDTLIEAGRQQAKPVFDRDLQEALASKLPVDEKAILPDWIPTRQESDKLSRVKDNLKRFTRTRGPARSAANAALLQALSGREPHWQVLRALKDDYLQKRAAGASQTAKKNAPAFGSDFVRNTDYLTLYIDESWPQEQQANYPESGVIAGLVWRGKDVDYNALPHIPTHLREGRDFLDEASRAIKNLRHCARCFPFIMTFENSGCLPQHELYEQIYKQALALLLGWLLPTGGNRETRIAVRLEQFMDYSAGQNEFEAMRGFFNGLAQQNPKRFSNWELDLVRWEGKDFEYIPYADLLAFLPHETTKARAILKRAKLNYRALPGYVPLSLDLVPLLNRLEQLEHGNVESVLECARQLSGTRLFEVLMQDVQHRLHDRPELQNKLLQALEERFQAKQRNLHDLRRQFQTVRQLVPDVPAESGMHVRLLWLVMGLQDANHHGDPDSAAEWVAAYRQIRDRAIEQDREFCTYVDLNLAVHYADRFEFTQAFEFVEQCHGDPHFEALPVLSRGRIHSSLGQYHSMQGRTRDAERAFIQALAHLKRADIPADARRGELDQTRVYRAINALDRQAANALRAVRVVLGGDLVAAARQLARADSGERLYHHHLLVRCLYYRPELQRERAAYLGLRNDWQQGTQHPWPLIMMYRGLLLWQAGESGAVQWFDEAIQAADHSAHGATLRLIGAMIAAVACRCLGDSQAIDKIRERTRQTLDDLRHGLPGAEPAIDGLMTQLQNPKPAGVNTALAVLPFNYH